MEKTNHKIRKSLNFQSHSKAVQHQLICNARSIFHASMRQCLNRNLSVATLNNSCVLYQQIGYSAAFRPMHFHVHSKNKPIYIPRALHSFGGFVSLSATLHLLLLFGHTIITLIREHLCTISNGH